MHRAPFLAIFSERLLANTNGVLVRAESRPRIHRGTRSHSGIEGYRAVDQPRHKTVEVSELARECVFGIHPRIAVDGSEGFGTFLPT
jgi:hypothetical protein